MEKQEISIIDSHTGGEPTRVVIDGFPELQAGTIKDRLSDFKRTFDNLRRAIVNEPRGYPAMVGALLCPPDNSESESGVIFFNNTGYLSMCGHGTIGVVKTLEYLNRLDSKTIRLDTVAGTVESVLNSDGSVSVQNVESFRHKKDAAVEMKDYGTVVGDIAWGGNWFYLIKDHGFEISMPNVPEMTRFSKRVLETLATHGYTGSNGELIDHVELFSNSVNADSRNFVLCPGGEYDRSPCGTGTSAKLACLSADGLLKEGETWLQESVTGSIFEGRFTVSKKGIIPTITGMAHITAESRLVFSEEDPFRYGLEQ